MKDKRNDRNTRVMKQFLLIAFILFLVKGNAQLYKDKSAAVEVRVNDLLSKMTPDEKIDYIGGYKGFYIRGIERLGLPEIKLTDGPVGTHKDGKSTAYPASILSAATWDTALVYELGKQLGRDSRARGVHVLLAPGVNIIRAPMGGRNFEYFSEDPLLASKVTVAYVKGLQDEKVVATVKHFAANNQEWDRHNVSSDIDERSLHEVYLAPFRAAVLEGKAGSVMTSYNLLNGIHTSEHNELNNEILKKKWGFDGFMMSDWNATYDAVAAANGGLDLEMPSARFMNKTQLLPAIKSGLVKQEVIDDKVRRILRIIFRFGFFDSPQLDKTIPLDNPGAAKVALDLARNGIVLLKNEKNILPLNIAKTKSIAVIGPNANSYISGGGSSYTFPFHSVSTLGGIQHLFTSSAITYAAGLPTLPDRIRQSVFYTEPGSNIKGLKAEYFSNIKLEGKPAINVVDTSVSISNGYHIAAENKGIPFDHCSMRWTGVVRPGKTTRYRFTVRGFDGFRLWINNKPEIDAWVDQGITTREAVVELDAGKEYAVRLEYFANVHPVDIGFAWDEDRLSFDDAIAAARKSEVAIVCVGFNESSERESNDRTFELPAYQDSLVNAVVKANPNTIVLLNAGGSADISKWINNVKGLLHVFYGGQEGGTAIAEILSGKINPSGKLPVTIEKRWEDNPAYNYYYDPSGSKRVSYEEGVFVGYRHYDSKKVRPQFPFGFGLSYSGFEVRNLSVTAAGKQNDPSVSVSFDITNTGKMDGAEVIQLYVRELKPALLRPDKELKSFAKIFLKKGETKRVTMNLDAAAFSWYDVKTKSFIYQQGDFELMLGNSSANILLKKTVHID
jgi:beta-glucosidase